MTPQAVLLLIVCILICTFLITYIVTFVCYHKTSKKGVLHKVYHDWGHCHLPDYDNIRELPESNNIQFISVCRFCGKEIFMARRKQKKWKTIDNIEENEK